MTRDAGTPDRQTEATAAGATGSGRTPTDAVWVGVDGSEHSERAVRWAARHAHARDLPLQLLNVVSVPAIFYSEPMAARFVEDERARIGAEMLRTAAGIARSAVGGRELTIGAQYETGSASEILIDRTAEARLLVLGTRGHGEFTGLIVGSVTRAVVAHAHCPTVVVPRPPEELPDPAGVADAPVVVGVDGSPSGDAALDVAFIEAERRGVELVAVHVWSDASVQPALGSRPSDPHWSGIQREEEERLGEVVAPGAARHPEIWVRQVVERENPVTVLARWSARAQLVVIGTRGRGGFTGLLMGSTSHALMHRAQCPLMIVRPAK